jgi:hypothetical protein
VFHFEGEITSESERNEMKSYGAELFPFEGVEKEAGWKNFRESNASSPLFLL